VEAEAIVLGVPRSLVCRTSGVFGLEPRRKNFVYQVVDRLRDGDVVRAAIDQILCPTAADELASTVTDLAALGVRGIVHVAGPEALPRADFARRIAQAFGLPPSSMEAVPTSALGSVARRPRDSSLRCDRLVAVTGHGLGPLDVALSRMRDAMQPEP
jgi:dTDP-4-dehydrorhamnose reductase